MIKQLPEESRMVAAMNGGDEHRGWTVDRYLRAKLIDAINMNTYMFISANSKRKNIKPPEPVRTPGDKARKKAQREKNPFLMTMDAKFAELEGQRGK